MTTSFSKTGCRLLKVSDLNLYSDKPIYCIQDRLYRVMGSESFVTSIECIYIFIFIYVTVTKIATEQKNLLSHMTIYV